VKELEKSKVQDQDEELVIETDEDTQEEDKYEGGSVYPYDMPKEVDVSEEHFTVFEINRKKVKKLLILNPEFQRNLVWKPEQKSRFIESILLNIPLPPFYVNQDKAGKFIIVDGLQRISTMTDFLSDTSFKLEKLKVLTDFNGFKFQKLPSKLQTSIEDKKLLFYVLRPSVPVVMVYDIFLIELIPMEHN